MGELDFSWAISQLTPGLPRRDAYLRNTNYYDGKHRVPFSTDKWREVFQQVFKDYSENMCAGVVDALADRLRVEGFRSALHTVDIQDVEKNTVMESAGLAGPPVEGAEQPPPAARKQVIINDPYADQAEAIWKRCQMQVRSGEVHEEALKTGDAYVIVWPDEKMKAAIWPQTALHMGVQYDPNTPNRLLRGTKTWWDEVERRWKLNIYLRTHIEKYQMPETNATSPEWATDYSKWQNYENVPNLYGDVPVFHFPNRNEAGYGVSVLDDMISIQDGLNKSDMDMLIAMEFASFKQRYVIGLEPEVDEETGESSVPGEKRSGVDRILAFSDPDTKVGQFDATDLGQFLRVQDKFWASAARVSGTPLHYFLITTGDFPSGEAMKSAEARFTNRIEDRQDSWGPRWGKVMEFALKIEGTTAEDMEMGTLWQDAVLRSDSEIADTAVKKKAVGVSRSQILKELGYDDETIESMLQESDAYEAGKIQMGMKEDDGESGTNRNGQPKPRPAGTQGVRR